MGQPTVSPAEAVREQHLTDSCVGQQVEDGPVGEVRGLASPLEALAEMFFSQDLRREVVGRGVPSDRVGAVDAGGDVERQIQRGAIGSGLHEDLEPPGGASLLGQFGTRFV